MSSAEACSRTVRKRSSELEEIRAGMSKDSRAQLQAEVKGLPASERSQLLTSAGITLDIPPEKGLALKANLAIPWNKLRTVRRYTAYSSYIHYVIVLPADGLQNGTSALPVRRSYANVHRA